MDSSILENLYSDTSSVRNELYAKLNECLITDLEKLIPDLFTVINKDGDELMKFQVAGIISRAFQELPALVDQYMDNIKSTLKYLSTQDLSDEHVLGSAAIHLFQHVLPKFQLSPPLLESWLDLLFELINVDGSLKYSASTPIVTVAMQQPVMLKDYVENIFDAIDNGFDSLSSSLYSLYNYNPQSFESRVEYFINKYQTDLSYQSIYLMVLGEIAKKKAELIAPHIDIFKQGLHNPSLASSIVILYTEIASYDANYIVPVIEDLLSATKYNQNLIYQVPNILGLIGRISVDKATEILEHLFTMLNDANDVSKGMILSEIRNLGEMDKKLLDKYIAIIEGFEDNPQEIIRDQAKMIMNFYRGIDVRSLANKIEDQNEKIRNAVKSVEDLEKYVDDNISELKEFIAEIAKKIPTPRSLSTEGRIRKTIILHFVCDKEGDRCIFPEDRDFTTETKDWSKWLKIAFAGINLGKSIIYPAAIGSAGKAVKQAYDAYKTKEDKDFLAYISQPFLTSEEQDNLVNQLRDAKFFDVFHYNAQNAGWICTMCNLM